jgi:hypothetical protein
MFFSVNAAAKVVLSVETTARFPVFFVLILNLFKMRARVGDNDNGKASHYLII